MATGEGEHWTDEELDLIVADYFLMLNDEAAGVSFNKAQHNRLLRSEIDRTKGSIEFKHQNISAIDRYLSQNPVALHPETVVGGLLAERPGLFVEAPPMLLPVTPRRED